MLQFLVSGAAERRARGLAQGLRGLQTRRVGPGSRSCGPLVLFLPRSQPWPAFAAIQVPKTLDVSDRTCIFRAPLLCAVPRVPRGALVLKLLDP